MHVDVCAFGCVCVGVFYMCRIIQHSILLYYVRNTQLKTVFLIEYFAYICVCVIMSLRGSEKFCPTNKSFL